MDPFWGITLSVLVISRYWKRERIKAEDRRYYEKKQKDDIEKAKQEEVIERYSTIFAGPMTSGEKAKIKDKKKVENERKKEIEHLRRQGYTDELIAVILPTINNGQ